MVYFNVFTKMIVMQVEDNILATTKKFKQITHTT